MADGSLLRLTTSSSPLPWAPTVPPSLGAAATAIAGEVAGRLRDRAAVELAAEAAAGQTSYPQSVRWQPASLAQGDAGVALACSCLDHCFSGGGWDGVGHGYLAAAGRDAEARRFLPIGMFGGLAGLGFAAWCLSRQETRYRRLLAEIDAALIPQAVARAGLTIGLAGIGGGMAVAEFDLISGLAGVGAYLLGRREHVAALEAVLGALVVLAGDDSALPGWWTPPTLMGNEDMAAEYREGNLNCGLAHGIPGPLAVLSLALSAGVDVEGLGRAVDVVAARLAGQRADDPWGVNWPAAWPVRSGADSPVASRPARSAWCYGAPGVARALWLAGEARGRAAWCDLAVAAMEATYRRPLAVRAVDSPTFCHGVAGLLQVTLRFAHDTARPVFAQAAADLTEQLVGLYEPDSRLGYRSFEPGGGRVDQPGLLDGAPGAALVLLAAATDVEPVWDRAFLLS